MNTDKTQARQRIRQIAQQYLQQGNPTGWFDAVYAHANGDESAIPWADMTVNPVFADWLAHHPLQGQGKTALVVGCGLGDDAEEIARHGFAVTAFDISPRAVEWCQRRFPQSSVQYQVVDLFQAPAEWGQHFDFVFECYTIQALPSDLHARAMQNVASFVAPGGNLLLICGGRDDDAEVNGPPWMLSHAEMQAFEQHGLHEVSFEDLIDQEGTRRFRVLYRA